MESLKVLIVEDDRMLCQVFEMFISSAGHKFVGFADDCETAIRLCEEQQPDVLLMDIHIKGKLNGIETNRILYEKFGIPTIFLSSDIELNTLRDAIFVNTYGFLIKPADKNLLALNIEFAYRKHKYMKDNNLL